VGYDEAYETLKAVVQKYDKVHEAAVKEVTVSRVAAFHTIGEVLYRLEKILNYISEIEKREEVGERKKVCNSWYYMASSPLQTISRLKPFVSITYDKNNNRATFSNKEISLSINPTQLQVRFRGKEFVIPLTLGDIEKNANLIKALSSRLTLFTDSLLTRIEQCAKLLYGIRI